MYSNRFIFLDFKLFGNDFLINICYLINQLIFVIMQYNILYCNDHIDNKEWICHTSYRP